MGQVFIAKICLLFYNSSMDLQNVLEIYSDKRKRGMDFSEIRSELTAKGLSETQVKSIIKEIDRKEISGELKKAKRIQSRELKMIGWTLMILGGIVTIGTHYQWFNTGGLYVLAYGPVIGGYLMIVSARRAQKRNK